MHKKWLGGILAQHVFLFLDLSKHTTEVIRNVKSQTIEAF